VLTPCSADCGNGSSGSSIDLKKIIKHHQHEAVHTSRLGARVAADFHIKAVEALEDIERRLGEAIVAGD
jgi:hypothetical protein